MANAPTFSNKAVNTKADQMLALLDGGALLIYDGAKPASADTPVTTQVLLAELTFGTPAFGAAAAGVAAANPIAEDPSTDATGTATWFRAVTSTGQPVFDGTVGTVAADLVLNSVAIQQKLAVSVTAFTYTERKS